jgi:hypothetical protein
MIGVTITNLNKSPSGIAVWLIKPNKSPRIPEDSIFKLCRKYFILGGKREENIFFVWEEYRGLGALGGCRGFTGRSRSHPGNGHLRGSCQTFANSIPNAAAELKN